jgi:hypothetical protein
MIASSASQQQHSHGSLRFLHLLVCFLHMGRESMCCCLVRSKRAAYPSSVRVRTTAYGCRCCQLARLLPAMCMPEGSSIADVALLLLLSSLVSSCSCASQRSSRLVLWPVQSLGWICLQVEPLFNLAAAQTLAALRFLGVDVRQPLFDWPGGSEGFCSSYGSSWQWVLTHGKSLQIEYSIMMHSALFALFVVVGSCCKLLVASMGVYAGWVGLHQGACCSVTVHCVRQKATLGWCARCTKHLQGILQSSGLSFCLAVPGAKICTLCEGPWRDKLVPQKLIAKTSVASVLCMLAVLCVGLSCVVSAWQDVC